MLLVKLNQKRELVAFVQIMSRERGSEGTLSGIAKQDHGTDFSSAPPQSMQRICAKYIICQLRFRTRAGVSINARACFGGAAVSLNCTLIKLGCLIMRV